MNNTMNYLLNKSKVDERKLYNYIKTISTQELSKLSEPCYYPSLKKHKFELLRICNLTENDLKEFPKRFYKGTKWVKFQLHNDSYTNLLLFIMYYFLINDNKLGFSSTMLLHNIRYYSNFIRISIKFCNEEIFKYALENLSSIHLFRRERTIGNALYFLSNQYIKIYLNDIKEENVDRIGKFIQESRHRIAQSVKSFATIYYDAHEKNKEFKEPEKYEEEEVEIPLRKGEILIDKFIRKTTTYKQYDRKAFELSIKQIKIQKNVAEKIIKELSDSKYNDDLSSILRFILDNINDLNILCSDKFKEEIDKLIFVKRIKEDHFKKKINSLLIKILKSIREYSNYEKKSNKDKLQINLFLAYYISLSFRNFIC